MVVSSYSIVFLSTCFNDINSVILLVKYITVIAINHIINILILVSNNTNKLALPNNDFLENKSILFFATLSKIKANIKFIIRKHVVLVILYYFSNFLFNKLVIVIIFITNKTNKYVYIDGK